MGREQEIVTACTRLRRDDVRLLTLTGPGGIGKTRLALAIAAALEPDVTDGVAWAPLAAIRDPDLVLPAIARSLGVGEVHHNASLVDAIDTAVQVRRLVLLVDNCEHVLTAVPVLSELLVACPTLKVLATSREPLRISGEWIQSVPPLSLPDPCEPVTAEGLERSDAVRLFSRRAESVSPPYVLNDATAPVVARICRHLEGLPLAIELAAARLYQLPLVTLSDRLERRLPLLAGGPRDVPARHQTMRDAIAWSYDLLPDRERTLFRALAVFAGGFTLDAAEAVGGGPSLDGLIALVDKSLIRQEPDARGESRYVLLELVREFAAEQLATAGEDVSVRQRHASFYMALATESHPWLTTRDTQPRLTTSEAPAWVDRLEADHENMRRALAWLAETGRWLDCLRLATMLGPFWDICGHLTEGRAWLERALGRSRSEGDSPALRAEATANLGLFVLRLGDHDHAEALLEEARAIWIQLGDTRNLPWLLMILGGVAEYREDDERAQSWYEEALAGFQAQGNVAGMSETLNNLADTAYRRADLGEAERLAEEALAVGRTAALPVQTGAALITIGAIACVRGAWDGAVTAHREALRLSRDAAHQLNVADAITGLAEVAAVTDDPERAARLLGAVDTMIDRLGVPRLPHQALHRRAIAATQAGLDPEAFAAAVAAGRLLSQEDAIAECEAVTGAPDVPASSRFTRREDEVLRLLVAGYTDRAIGETLFIGTRTVESHVARIFTKLGVRTRSAAVAAVLANGLIEPPKQPPDSSHS